MRITIGADPEFFLRDRKTGSIVSAVGLIEGTKSKPLELAYGGLQRDNILGELNILPASSSMKFVQNVESLVKEVTTRLYYKGLVLDWSSSYVLDDALLNHPLARKFGCSPNFNCWDIDDAWHPTPELAGNLRTAAGHIHIGSSNSLTVGQKIRLAQACEVHIGLPMVHWDRDARRRTLYGRAGSFRPKPYGIEYTVPSNVWLRSSRLTEWVASAVSAAYAHINEDYSAYSLEIRNAINECDTAKAKALCRTLDVNYGDTYEIELR